jgi:hypothetical protein
MTDLLLNEITLTTIDWYNYPSQMTGCLAGEEKCESGHVFWLSNAPKGLRTFQYIECVFNTERCHSAWEHARSYSIDGDVAAKSSETTWREW